MRTETNEAYHKAVQEIKRVHQQKGLSFSDLRIVVRIYEDEKFEVIYICPPENDPIFFSWPNDFKPNVEADKPEKIVLLRFTELGFEAPVIAYKKSLSLILNRYLEKKGLERDFVASTVVKNDIYEISVISRDESLSQIHLYGARSKEDELLPLGNGDYLVLIKNGQIIFSNFST